MSKQQSDRNFNVIIQGFGYINRIREVQPKNGDPYLACDVAFLQGTQDNIEYARFNCVIRGRAKGIIRALFAGPQGKVVPPEKTTVRASMVLGGVSPRTFVYNSGDKKGQTGIAIHSVMLSIKWLKVGDVVIDLEPGSQEAGNAQPANQAANGQPDFVREMVAEYRQNGSVSLSKEHPEFEERRTYLKNNGFTWNKDKQAWVKKDNGNSDSKSQAPQAPPPQAASDWPAELDDDIPF